MITVRPAELGDLEAITGIYNDAILNTVATFDTEPRTLHEQQTWFAEHDATHPILVAEDGGVVVGWASLSKWSDRCAYADAAEGSVYVAKERRATGIGRRLSEALLAAAREAGLHTVIARIAEGNEASLHLCESLGFTHVGTMREVGRKFGRLLDVHILQIIFEQPA